MQSRLLTGLVAAIALGGAGAQAQESLSFATTNPEMHPINQGYLIPWAEAISADGVVDIQLRHGPMIANHTNFYDRVVDDVVQIGWGMTVFNPGRFPRTLVATLPFMVDSAEQGSAALCTLYEDGAFDEEFHDIVPLLFVEFPQASLHMNGAPVTNIGDAAGKKVITTSPAIAGMLGDMGAAPLSFPITEQYEALQRGAADGTVLNFTAFPGFRLNEVTTDHLVVPLGGAMGMVFTSSATWDELSEAAQASIMAHSGCDASRAFGAWIDDWEAESMEMVVNQEGHTVTYASPEEIEMLVSMSAEPMAAGFSEQVPGGAELIDAFRAALEEVSAQQARRDPERQRGAR